MVTATEQLRLSEALVRLAHLVQHVFADVSREYNLTPQQAQLLCRLVPGPVGMSELSRSLHLEKSSLTGLIDRVERRGLVTRTRNDRDRRACQIALTGSGTELAVATHQDVTARIDELAGELSRADQQRLTSLIVGSLLCTADR